MALISKVSKFLANYHKIIQGFLSAKGWSLTIQGLLKNNNSFNAGEEALLAKSQLTINPHWLYGQWCAPTPRRIPASHY
ncbi:hypothetical protein [Gynuella sunshinyii]|uniref:hypothetical protein n=1 Tax=Gynuella sunshinyii TaxID=1445505 RepID=UPI001184DF77|nr:hypothetical protein [Gynuella sunshinyii]